MMVKSKRNVLAILIVAALAFLTIGFAKQNVKANADEEDGFSATLSSVKYNVSNDGEYTLLAAAITTENMNRIYEVGFYAYDGEEKVALAPVAATSKTTYYTAINDADSKTIFGTETALPMIVWKVATPNAAVSYEAYVKYGYINENDENRLWSYATEKTVNSAKKAMAFYTVTIDEDGGDAVADLTVLAGTPASALSGVTVTKTGYHYDGWEYEASADVWQDLSSSATVTANVTVRPKWVANVYTLTFKDGEDTVDTKNSTYNSAIGELPAAPAKLGYTFTGWTIDGDAITAETLYSADTDKIAMANYTLNTVHDNTATFAADFSLESNDDYAVNAAFAANVIAVKINGEDIAFTADGENNKLIFANAIVKAMAYGDYTLEAYTATDTYRMKVAVVTKVINGVEDFPCVDAATLDGYYIVGQDFDAQASATSPVSMLHFTGNPRTNAAEANNTLGFKGIFDGRGHVITNLTVQAGGYAYMGGLFGSIQSGAIIRDVAFINMESTGASYKFLFAGESCCMKGAIENVVVTTQNSDRLFGFVRANNNSVVGYIKNMVFVGGKYFAYHDRQYDGSEGNRMGDQYPPHNNNILMVTSVRQVESSASNAVYGATRYATTNAMLNALEENNVIANWNSDYISYSSGTVFFNGKKVVTPVIGLTASNNEVNINGSMTFTATDAVFSLKEAVAGASINAMTGVLTVGAVAVDTQITVVATSTIDPTYTEEMTVTVALECVDLTANGTYDIELGSAHGIAAIEGDVIAIKTAAGTKVTLANANVITAAELNSAAGVNYSEGLAVTFYTEDKAYSLNAAFITKLIHNYAEFSSLANVSATLDGYYVIANSFEANNETAMARWTAYSSTESTGFIGILDGRNHIISNLKVNDRFMGGVGKCTIKNIAFVNFTQATAGHPMFGETHGATVKNVLVTSTTATNLFDSVWNTPSFENVVYVTDSEKADKGLFKTGSTGTLTVKNTIAIYKDANYPYGYGYYGATVNRTNAVGYTSETAMMAALTETTFDGWNSPFTFDGTNLKFNGTTVLSAS